jgi:hypothetical protein
MPSFQSGATWSFAYFGSPAWWRATRFQSKSKHGEPEEPDSVRVEYLTRVGDGPGGNVAVTASLRIAQLERLPVGVLEDHQGALLLPVVDAGRNRHEPARGTLRVFTLKPGNPV